MRLFCALFSTMFSISDMKLKRLRRPNFSAVELETLVDILENYPELTVGKVQNQQCVSQKELWVEVAALLNNSECNSGDPVDRTAKEVREKWIDFKCRLKKRYRYVSNLGGNSAALSSNHNNNSDSTGKPGVNSTSPHLTSLDLKALKLLTNAQKKLRATAAGSSAPTTSAVSEGAGSRGTAGRKPTQKRVAPRIVDSKEWQSSTTLLPNIPVDVSPSTSGSSSQNAIHIIPIYSNGPSNASSHSLKPQVRQSIDLIQVNDMSPQEAEFNDLEEEDSTYQDYDNTPQQQHTMGSHLANDYSEENTSVSFTSGRTTTETLLGAMVEKQDRVIDLMMELVSETGQRRAVEEEAVGLLRNLVALQARRVQLEEMKLGIGHGSSPGDDLDT